MTQRILQGKTAIITGGTRGLGLATARTFLQAGANIVICSRKPQAVQSSLESLAAEGFSNECMIGSACDVGSMTEVEALANLAISRYNQFDIWINNAGISAPYGPTAHIPADIFDTVIKTNILGTYYGSQVALAHFLTRQEGKLINMLGAGEKRPIPFQNGYASTKSWIRIFTLALAKEYQNSGVDIFAYNPGLMFTDMVEKVDALAGYERRVRALETVLRMWGNPTEIPAHKLAWLASDASDGKNKVSYREMSFLHILNGATQEVWRRIKNKKPTRPHLRVNTITPSLANMPMPEKDKK